KPYFSATFCATGSSIVEFIAAKPTNWLSSEMSLNGFNPSATAKSRTTIGGLRWRIFTSPEVVIWGVCRVETEAIGTPALEPGKGGGFGAATAARGGNGGGAMGALAT